MLLDPQETEAAIVAEESGMTKAPVSRALSARVIAGEEGG